MPKSVSKSPKIILASDNSNWINILEAEKPLLPSEPAMSQQPLQLIDLLTEALRKLAANLIFSIART